MEKGNNKGQSNGAIDSEQSFETRAIHESISLDQRGSGFIVSPIHTGSVFSQDDPETLNEYYYGRFGNPTRKSLETCIASLDKAKYALTFASGMNAIAGVGSLLKAGDHVICGDDLYGCTYSYFSTIAVDHGVEVDFIDTKVVENIEKAIKPNTKMVYIESPTNPLLKVMDTPSIAAAVKAKSQDIILAVDNTFLTPYLHNPLSVGFDISIYSLTKFMNGHSDVIMGAITTNSDDIYKKLTYIIFNEGPIPSPFDCYLVNRSLKTLKIRMDTHVENATKIAKFLEQHPLVEQVLYPGLESHPQYKLAQKLWRGPSAIISVYLKGDLETSKSFVKSLKYFKLAGSLGGCSSSIQIPSKISHKHLPAEVKEQLRITDNLLRFSIGLESATDLIKDIDQALKIASNV